MHAMLMTPAVCPLSDVLWREEAVESQLKLLCICTELPAITIAFKLKYAYKQQAGSKQPSDSHLT